MPREITERSPSDPMWRTVNTGLMVAWINHDLINRAWGDVRTSWVLYDEDGDFVYAFPATMDLDDVKTLAALVTPPVHQYSKGIV